ncbi:MAG TPA: YigZ family protein [Thermoanaerobaculia bacterium]
MPADHFRTLAAAAEFRQKIERSEFLGIAFPVSDDGSFHDELLRIEKKYFDATHHCWAFRLFIDGRQRSSDAGEPAGTAGKPILSAIEAAALLDVAVVVVRWFGGVKLGSGGLVRAYRDTAAKTLERATLSDRYICERFTVVVPFDSISVAYRLVSPPAITLVEERFEERNEFVFEVRQSQAEDFTHALTERRLNFARDVTPRLR